MNELDLLLKIASLKDGEPLCHTQSPEYHALLKLCRALKERGFISYRKPSSGIYTQSTRMFYSQKRGYLTARLTYDGIIEVERIRSERRKLHISFAALCITLAGLLVPLLCKYIPVLSKYIQSLLKH